MLVLKDQCWVLWLFPNIKFSFIIWPIITSSTSTPLTIERLADEQVYRGDVVPRHKSQTHRLSSPLGRPLFILPVHKDSSRLRHYLASTRVWGNKSSFLAAALRSLSSTNFVQSGCAQPSTTAIITLREEERWESVFLVCSAACGDFHVSYLRCCRLHFQPTSVSCLSLIS